MNVFTLGPTAQVTLVYLKVENYFLLFHSMGEII